MTVSTQAQAQAPPTLTITKQPCPLLLARQQAAGHHIPTLTHVSLEALPGAAVGSGHGVVAALLAGYWPELQADDSVALRQAGG